MDNADIEILIKMEEMISGLISISKSRMEKEKGKANSFEFDYWDKIYKGLLEIQLRIVTRINSK